MQQEHQVLLAARLEEGYHFLILLDSSHNFALVQGPAAVLVDQLEALARGVFEVERELLDFFLRRLGLHFALGRAVGQLVRQRDLDGLLPALLWTGEPRNASTLSRPRRRRTSTPPARHHRSTPPPQHASPRRRHPQVSDSETHHSESENSPSLSVSIWASAESRRAGTSRYWRFLLPQFVRKSMTFLSARTDLTCA